MTREELIKELFSRAREAGTPGAREALLGDACRGDPGLRQEVESLLLAYAQVGTFLGQSVQLPKSDASGEQSGMLIGRYKLLEQIGEGGFGVVWMAEQEAPVRRRVALKIIKLGMDTKEVVARFEAERQALAMMDHPNIASVLDGGATDTGRPYFVMELVRGIPITQFCDERNLTTRERLELFMQVCLAVQHAHQKGIIHRDLKPSNVLVTVKDDQPVPKVIDFGVAKATQARLTEKTLFTRFQQWIGTPAYMSPEQAGLASLDVDTRSDVYSLGVLLYELLTGHTPFDLEMLRKSALDEIRRMIRETEPPKPSTRLQSLGEAVTEVALRRQTEPRALHRLVRGDLDWVVMRCLEKDRTRRYDTADALRSDLRSFLDNQPIAARPPGALYRFQKLVRRNKLAFAAGAGVALALLLGLGVSTWLFFKEREARRRAVAAEQVERDLRQKAQTSELSARALLCWSEGRLDEAESLQREALALWRRELGNQHPQVATALENLAAIVRDRGRLDEATQLYADALKLRRSGESDLKVLNQQLSQGLYGDLEALLNRALPQSRTRSQILELLTERGLAAARLGQWRIAAGEYARLVEISPGDADAGHALAALLVHTSDEPAYRRHCALLLERFGRTTDPVLAQALIRDCLLLPDTGTNVVRLAALADSVLTNTSNHWASGYFGLAKGLVGFRIGRFAVATEQFESMSLDTHPAGREAQMRLLLGMSQYQLKQIPAAKTNLARAIKIIGSKLPKVEDGLLGLDWVEWLQTQALLREARLMIED